MTGQGSATLRPGQNIGRYEIVAELGRGGMAVVYKARQPSLDRFVALKVLALELTTDPEFVSRFRREATIAARLEHPNIVPIHDVGEAGGVLFIAQRFVDGQTLADLIHREGCLPLDRTIELLSQVGAALDFAHRQGVIHRDVKSGNILLDSRGEALLADFGIARASDSTRVTRIGAIAGTVEYMAPEQAQGLQPDHRADLYALGIIAFELLTGRTPFHADSATATIYRHVHEPPPPVRSVRTDVPNAVEAAIQSMLAKRPDERFQSAAAFVGSLSGVPSVQTLTQPGESRGQPASAPARAGPPSSRRLNPAAVAVMSAGLVLLVLVAVITTRPTEQNLNVQSLPTFAPAAVSLVPTQPRAAVSQPTAAPVATSAPSATSVPTVEQAWAATERELDPIWENDWPRVIAVLDGFRSRFADFMPAKEKLYVALVARGNDLQRQGQADEAVAHYLRGQIVLPGRSEAAAALLALTPTPLPSPPTPTVAVAAVQFDRAAVLAAVDRANAAWTDGKWSLDPSSFRERLDGQELIDATDEIIRQRSQNIAKRAVNTAFQVTSFTAISPTRAQVKTRETWYDDIYTDTSRQYQRRAAATTYTETYTVDFISGRWIVTYIVLQ